MLKKVLYLFLIILTGFSEIGMAQYCLPTYTTYCTSNDYINNFSTTGAAVNITNLNTGCSGAAPNNYIYYSALSVSQMQGASFNFTVQSGTTWAQGFRIWVDWNQDLDFADIGEDVYASPNSATTPFTGTITVPITATPGATRMRVLCRFAVVPAVTDYCGTTFSYGECEDYVMNVIPALPCTGTPTAGTITPGSTILCAGQSIALGLSGATIAGGLSYQWQQSTNGGLTWINVIGGTGANSPGYLTPTLSSTIMYRAYLICNTNGLSDTTAPITISISGPSYAALPYTQDFEVWGNYCAIKDVPFDSHWSNSPATGNNSWRRNDEGATAWTGFIGGNYTPTSSTGSYSARFHSYNHILTGDLDLYVDCSAQPGTKTLFFDYMNDNVTLGGFDYLQVLYSDNGGGTFVPLGNFNNSPNWTTNSLSISSNSPNTIIRFRGVGDNDFAEDIGLDNVILLPPCTGKPTAGIIDSITPCANKPFWLTLSNDSLAGGLIYTWESAPSAAGPWTFVNATAGPTVNTMISGATYFRCIVQCTNSGLSDTTPVRHIDVASFYYCYCESQSQLLTFYVQNIGNVTVKNAQNVTILNNGTATPLTGNPSPLNFFTNFTYLPPTDIYKDSTFNFSATCFTQASFFYNGYAKAYIDFNRDGVYDPLSEVVASGVVNSPAQSFSGSFTVPSNAQSGITGMRVVYRVNGSASTVNPCGLYGDGETENYLVNITLPPCSNPPNAGTAHISDTITCPGYTVFLTDTTHDVYFQNLSHIWQVSFDGINFADIVGATADTLSYTVNSPTWFRFRTNCSTTSSGYSNVVHVAMSPPASCYGISQATGGSLDSSDIGAFTVSETNTSLNIYSFVTGGPHLMNPAAVRQRTDYTSSTLIDLVTDSTYKFSVYHIMRSATHADAKVTIFIDYNNNQLYDIPQERVYTGIADISNFYLNATVTTPVAPAVNVPTGLRVILNNNVSSNPASDNGVGTYVSGETEDYLVRFRLKQLIPSNTSSYEDVEDIGVYPNPAYTVLYTGLKTKTVTDINYSLLSLTGATVYEKKYENIDGNFVTEIPVGNLARGSYLLKIKTSNSSFVRKVVIQ